MLPAAPSRPHRQRTSLAKRASAPSAVRGSTARAARRTPGSALAKAALAASNASPFADVQCSQAVHRPQRVDSAPAPLLASLHHRRELRKNVRLAAFHQQPLGRHAPPHIFMRKRGNQLLFIRAVERRLGLRLRALYKRCGRCGRASCRATASRRRRPCRSRNPWASGCAAR